MLFHCWLDKLLALRSWIVARSAVKRTRFTPKPWLETLEARVVPTNLVVMNNADSGSNSLRAAIAASASGDIISFAPSLAGETITLTSGELAIGKTLTIAGLGADQLTLSANNASRVFDVTAGTVQITGLTLTKGAASGGNGGAILNAGTLTLTDDALTQSTASGTNGTNPGSGGFGGGIANTGTLTVVRSTLSGNTAQGGNGASGNAAGGGGVGLGGGVFNATGATLTLLNSTLSGNSAVGGTGGDGTRPAASSTAAGSNGGGDGGAGAPNGFASGGAGNFGGGGGGGWSTFGSAFLTVGGTGGFGGGGGGGGAFTTGNGTGATGGGSTLYGGTGGSGAASFGGGGGGGAGIGAGLFSEGGTVTITASTIASNTATGGAGGAQGGTAGQGVAGGVYVFGGTATIDSTIIASNTAATDADVTGSVTDSGYNLIGNTTGSSGFTNVNDILNQSANLLPLGNYGGATQTMALKAGSVALNDGDPNTGLTVDQRGARRGATSGLGSTASAGTVPDIGAYEASSLYVVATADANTTPTGYNTSTVGSLRGAVSWANSSSNVLLVTATANTIAFDTTTFATAQTITLGIGQLTLSNTSVAETITGPGAATLTVSGNSANRVFQVNSGVTATLSGMTISQGVDGSLGGSAVYNSGTLTLDQVVVSDNTTTLGGLAGVVYDTGTLTITHSTIANNKATSTIAFGGGLAVEGSTATLQVSNSTISDNTAAFNGGLVVNDSAQATLSNTTIANNTGQQGAIAAYNSGTVTIANSTVANNPGGGLLNSSSTFSIKDTLVAGNTGFDVSGNVGSLGHNLIGNSSGGSGLAATDLTNVTAQIGALADNGGSTKAVALLAGSPAIDAGDNSSDPTTDQRGGTRIVNSIIDIGAFEDQVTVTAPTSSPSSTVGSSVSVSLGSFHDAATAATSWSVDVNWGDATGDSTFTVASQGSLGSLTHTFAHAGTDTVTVTVTDAFNNSQSANFTVSVQKATPTVTWASPSAITYGTALSATQLDATSATPGSFAYSPASGAILNAGSQTLSTTFTPTNSADFNSVTATVTLVVNQATPGVGISAPTVTYNANGAVVVTVTSTAGTPTGNVALAVDGGSAMSQALVSGSTTFTLTSPSAGDHSLSASYAAQGNFAANSATGSLHVNQAATSVTITAPTLTYNANENVTLSVSSAAGTPAGSVSYSVDGGAATAATLSNGSALIGLTSPSAGDHTITANYGAQGNFAASSSSTTFHINQASTSESLFAPAITYNANGSVTVTVSSGAGTPTGSVLLSVDGGAAQSQTLGSGSAPFTLSGLTAGDHALTTTYNAQGNFAASSANGIIHVNQAATSIGVTAPTITYNANDSVVVTLSSGAGTPGGSVSLSLDGGAATTQTLASGSATFTLTSPGAGTHTLLASYAAQGNFAASTGSGTLLVNPAATTVGVSGATVTYNASGNVVVTVTSVAGTPTGNALLSVDNAAPLSQPLVSGSTTFTVTSLSAGDHALFASYTAQGNFAANSSSGILHVNQAPVFVSVVGSTITYNANEVVTVAVGSAAGTPAGSVSLSVDGGAPLTQPLTNGSTLFTLTSPSAGDHTIAASYIAQGNFGQGSASTTFHVNRAATSTALFAPTITYNGNENVVVTLASAAGTPAGSVTLALDGGGAVSTTLTSGSATFTLTSPSAGDHTITAGYLAQGNYAASSAVGTFHVNQASDSVSLVAPTITYNTNDNIVLTLSSAAGTPAGNVSLSVDGGAATTQALTSGSATFTLTSPSAGTHTLLASYAAQGNFAASTGSGTLIVNPAATSVGVSAATVTYNANGNVVVTVTSAAGTPTGNVLLSFDGAVPLSLPLASGSTTFTLTSPSAGDHSFTASYAAQGNYAANSKSGVLHVNPAATSVGVSAATVTYNTNGSVLVTVNSAGGTPGGNVTLSVDGGTALSQTLTNGTAVFTLPSPSAGSHTLLAAYATQGNFTGNTSSATLTINQAPTTTLLVSQIDPSFVGGLSIFTATVTSAAGTPPGSVNFSVDGGTPVNQTLSGGTAVFTTRFFTVGSHVVTATYVPGSSNFSGSISQVLTQDVNKNDTTTSLAAPAATSFGNTINFTATVAPIASATIAPSGSITFVVDNATATSVPLTGLQATLSLSALPAGSHTLTALYSGDSLYNTSTSNTVTEVVSKIDASVALAAVPATVAADQSVSLTATLIPVSGSGVATGNVTFFDNGTPLGAAGLLNNTATLTITPLVGTHLFTATQSGDANFNPSASATGVTVVVGSQPERFVQQLYVDFLGRPGTTVELDYWASKIETQGTQAVANGVAHADESLKHLIDLQYQKFLGRGADPAGLAFNLNILKGGGTEEQVILNLLTSPEFARLHHLTTGATADQAYVHALYQVVLNRNESAADDAFWVGQDSAGVAASIVGGSEFRGDVVSAYYGPAAFAFEPNILHRSSAPAVADVQFWANANLDLYTMAVDFAGNGELFRKS